MRRHRRVALSPQGGGTRAWALAVMAGSLLAASPAGASFPGSSGRLAAEYEIQDRVFIDREIRVLGRGGKRGARLSPCEIDWAAGGRIGVCADNPSFSPDGRRIAFDRGRRLALADADGTGLVPLRRLTAADTNPAFSPDGTRLVFTGLERGKRNLYSVRVDGSGLKRLTNAGGTWPAWSSRGRIAYVAAGRIWLLRSGRPGRTALAKGRHPDWSPSGRSVAYDYGRKVYRVAIRRGAMSKLLQVNGGRPAFSPDGKRIAFERHRMAGKVSLGASIHTIDADTGTRSRLIRRGGVERPEGSTFASFTAVAWQPLRSGTPVREASHAGVRADPAQPGRDSDTAAALRSARVKSQLPYPLVAPARTSTSAFFNLALFTETAKRYPTYDALRRWFNAHRGRVKRPGAPLTLPPRP